MPRAHPLYLSDHNHNAPPQAAYRLMRPNFRRLADFGLAVHSDFSTGDHMLALPAAIGDAGEFEQVAQRNVLSAQFEFCGVHS